MLNLSCIAIILQNDKYLFKEPCTEGTRRQSHIFRLQTESGSRGCLKRGWDLKACDQQNVCRPTYSGKLIKQINNESGCSSDIIACFPRKKITSVFLSYPGPAYFPIQYRMYLVLCFFFFVTCVSFLIQACLSICYESVSFQLGWMTNSCMLVFKNHKSTPIQHLTVVLPFLCHEMLVSDVL